VRLFRRTLTSVFAGVTLVALSVAVPGQRVSDAASPAISLAVTSANASVNGDTYVPSGRPARRPALRRGGVVGAPAGASVVLVASPFPFRGPTRVVASKRLHPASGRSRYSFRVSPDLATRYVVEVKAGDRRPGVLTRSRPSMIYVAAEPVYLPSTRTSCSRPTCHETFSVTVSYPGTVARLELAKAWHTYLGVDLLPLASPPPPRLLTLRQHWKVSAHRRIGPQTYETTFALSFGVARDGYDWLAGVCTRSTEGRDGFGLPGRHSCGAERVPAQRFGDGYVG
jgi:hypothetical protein